jgi:hypothetical protein
MPHFLATTVVTLLAGSVQPIPQMPLPQMNPQFNQGFTQAPFTIDMPPVIGVKPYGPSFRFNGLTVYVEPIETASGKVSTSSRADGARIYETNLIQASPKKCPAP